MIRRGKSPQISLIVPVYNENKYLSSVVKNTIAKLDRLKLDYEIILVENNSSDGSYQTVDLITKKYKNVRAIHLPYSDYGLALKTGFLASNAEIMGNLSVDWTDADFVKRASSLMNKYDIVISSKNLAQSEDKRPLLRRSGGRLFHHLVSLLFAIPGYDTHGIKLFKRNSVAALIKKCVLSGETFDTELIIRAYKSQLKILEIPAKVQDRRPTRVNIIKRCVKALSQLIYLRIIFWQEDTN